MRPTPWPVDSMRGLRFERCFFDNCAVYPSEPGVERTRLRNIAVVDCRVWACHVDEAIVEDVVVDGLKTGGSGGRTIGFSVNGAALRHVVFRGRIGSVGISVATRVWHRHNPSLFERLFHRDELSRRAREQTIDEANARYYDGTDWALDISEAHFYSVAIHGIPAHLIRRDFASQAVVTRTKAKQRLPEAFEQFPELGNTYWPYELERFLRDDSAQEVVLVAPRRHPTFKVQLDGIKMLRDAGVAETE